MPLSPFFSFQLPGLFHCATSSSRPSCMLPLHIASCLLMYDFSTPKKFKPPYFLQIKLNCFSMAFSDFYSLAHNLVSLSLFPHHISSSQSGPLIVHPSIISYEVPPQYLCLHCSSYTMKWLSPFFPTCLLNVSWLDCVF